MGDIHYHFCFVYTNGYEKNFCLESDYIFLEKTIQKYMNINEKYLKEAFIGKYLSVPNDSVLLEVIYHR